MTKKAIIILEILRCIITIHAFIVDSGIGGDNWGAPLHKIEVYKGKSLNQLSQECDWKWGEFGKDFDKAALNYYKNTDDWKNFKGFDLIPEHHATLVPKYQRYDTTTYKTKIMGGRCNIPPPNDNNVGVRWTIERIGPLKSVGGYDWWQFAWSNPFQTNEILKKYSDGYYILNHFSGAVDRDGNILDFPPIHVHHVHCSPGSANPMRYDVPTCAYTMNSEDCPQAQRTVFEQHGDYQCLEEDGGSKCLLEDMPNGYAKLVTTPLSINGELNDCRAAGEPEIEWYYQTAIRWIPKIDSIKLDMKLKPLSMHYFWSPGRFNLYDQSTMVNTFKAPTGDDSMLWYTGRMHYDGELIRGKMHTHNTVFKEAFFFSGTPDQLGLTGKRFLPPTSTFEPLLLKDIGFKSIEDAIQYFLSAYHQNMDQVNEEGISPRFICHGSTKNEDIVFPTGVYKFDRRANTWCNPWSFKKGEPFTVIGFNQHAGGPPGPHMPDQIPKWLPGHLHWFLFSDTHDNHSHYEYGVYSQEVEHTFLAPKGVYFPNGGRLNTLSVVLSGGMPSSSQLNLMIYAVFFLSLIFLSSCGVCTYRTAKYVKLA